MENGFLFSDAIKNGADGIGNSAEQDPEHTREGKNLDGLFEADYDEPAHKNIKNHGKLFIFVVVNGGEGCGKSRKKNNNGRYKNVHLGLFGNEPAYLTRDNNGKKRTCRACGIEYIALALALYGAKGLKKALCADKLRRPRSLPRPLRSTLRQRLPQRR